jgi:hypothetical protein
MSAEEKLDQFEERTRVLLQESVTRVDARIRSRLNQARHAALEELEQRARAPWWRSYALAPAAGVAAAVLVAFVLWSSGPGTMNSPAENGGSGAVEDLDLVADGDTFDLLQQGDGGFYEWAVAQADAGQEATS